MFTFQADVSSGNIFKNIFISYLASPRPTQGTDEGAASFTRFSSFIVLAQFDSKFTGNFVTRLKTKNQSSTSVEFELRAIKFRVNAISHCAILHCVSFSSFCAITGEWLIFRKKKCHVRWGFGLSENCEFLLILILPVRKLHDFRQGCFGL